MKAFLLTQVLEKIILQLTNQGYKMDVKVTCKNGNGVSQH